MIQYSDKYITIKVKRPKDSVQSPKPTKNVKPQGGLNSSWSMTDKEINPSPEGTDLNLQRFKNENSSHPLQLTLNNTTSSTKKKQKNPIPKRKVEIMGNI